MLKILPEDHTTIFLFTEIYYIYFISLLFKVRILMFFIFENVNNFQRRTKVVETDRQQYSPSRYCTKSFICYQPISSVYLD